jgi:hypothetical protein
MHTVNRILVVFLSLLLIAAAAGLITLAWVEDRFLNLELDNFDLEAAIVTDGTSRLVFTVVCAAIGALGLAFIALQFVRMGRQTRDQVVRLRQASGDQVELSTTTIESMIRQELEQLPEVRRAAVLVREEKNGLASVLDLHLEPDATVAHVTSEASHVVTAAFRERLGMSSAHRPLIRVHYDELNLAPGARHIPLPPPASSQDTQRWEMPTREEALSTHLGEPAPSPETSANHEAPAQLLVARPVDELDQEAAGEELARVDDGSEERDTPGGGY